MKKEYKESIADIFKGYKEEFNAVCNIEIFKNKVPYVHNIAYQDISRKREIITNKIRRLEYPANLLLPEIENWIEGLEEQVYLNNQSKDKLRRSLVSYINEFIIDLKDIKNRNPSEGAFFTIKCRLPKETPDNKSILQRKQVALLMHLLRSNKIFNKDASDELLGECMGALTGFSGRQLVKDYGDLKSHRIEVGEYDVNTLKEIMMNLHDKAEEQLDKI